MNTPSRRWTGGKDSGSNSYSPAIALRVLSILQGHFGHQNSITPSDLALAAQVEGRALRQICSDLDGTACLLGFDGERYFLAVTADESEEFTNRLQSQVDHMQKRINLRRAFASTLPRDVEQKRLFG